MTVTKEKGDELLEMAKPLIKWLNENLHPHTHIIITTNTVELSEGICARQTDEFIKD